MTKVDEREEDLLLHALFEAGKTHTARPDEAFLARLEVEAESAVPRHSVPERQRNRYVVFARFKRLFTASGLSGAAALGLWLGFILPEIVNSVSPFADDTTALSIFLPGSDLSVLSE